MSTKHDGDQLDTPPIGAADAEIIDRLIENGLDPASMPAADRRKAERLMALLSLLDQYPTESESGSNDLVQSTLARINEHESQATAIPFRMTPVEPAASSSNALSIASLHWRDLMTAAAVVMLLVSVAAPMLNQSRASAAQIACRANMGGAGIGLTAYAADYRGALPQVQTAPPSGNWMKGRPNSGNYVYLAQLRYADPDCLHCPGRKKTIPNAALLELGNWPEGDMSGYAFQFSLSKRPTRWDSLTPTVIMSDVNPIVYRQMCGEETNCEELSPCHGGDGMNALVNDGSAQWLDSPTFHDDNIWLPANVTGRHPRLTGVEAPVDEYDSMLVP